MKKLILIIFIFTLQFSYAQINTVTPNHAKRGQTLTTTVTITGAMMTISSGMGSSYKIWIKQGTDSIVATSYTYTTTGYGFATSFLPVFNIPLNASLGNYDLWIGSTLPYSWPTSKANAFKIFENIIDGKVYFDANQNGVFDINEYGVGNQNIVLQPGSINLLTDANGYYKADLDTGIYTVTLSLAPYITPTSSPAFYSVVVPPNSNGNDFGVYSPPDSVYRHDFSTGNNALRCWRNSITSWTVSSSSNNIQNGTVTMILDTTLTYISSNIIPYSINGDTLRWTYSLQPFQSFAAEITIHAGPVNSPHILYIDSLFDYAAAFISTTTDTLSPRIRCSMDPNEKLVTPEGSNNWYHYVDKTGELIYTINFQNCGSDTAYDISILDNIDPNLDLSTLRIINSSAPMSLQVESYGVLRFLLNNILLPDSNIDELHSHGSVTYGIFPVQNIWDGTRVKNKAFIYFDHNPAVITNETFNTLVTTVPTVSINTVEKINSFVYPNPITESSVLIIPNKSKYNLKIFDLTGKEILSIDINENYPLRKNHFRNGMYYYQLLDWKNGIRMTGKFIVVE